jgi:hypothetical protein
MGIKFGSSRHFAKAMRFYDLSLSTVECMLQGFGYDSNMVLMLCSLYNNMGHVHALFNDVEETQFCLDWLQKAVTAEEFNDEEVISEEDSSFFSQYLMYDNSAAEHFRAARAA